MAIVPGLCAFDMSIIFRRLAFLSHRQQTIAYFQHADIE